MIRQVVFTLLLSLALAPQAIAQTPPAAPRPAADIPLTRLTADAAIPVALGSGAIESADAVWVPNRAAGSLVRIDAKDNQPGAPVVVGAQPCASLVVAFDSVWVPLCGDGTIARIDPKASPMIDPKASKPSATLKTKVASNDGRIATAVGSVWAITDRKGVLSRIDPDTNTVVAEVYVAAGASAVVFGEEALWITSDEGATGHLTRVNPHNNEIVEVIEVGPKPGRLAVGEGGVWTLNRGAGGNGGTVSRVDPATNKVVATIPVGDAAATGEIAAGLGSVWISAPGVPLLRIDPRTNRAVQRFTGDGGGAVLVAHGSLWIAAGPLLTWRLDPLLVAAIRP